MNKYFVPLLLIVFFIPISGFCENKKKSKYDIPDQKVIYEIAGVKKTFHMNSSTRISDQELEAIDKKIQIIWKAIVEAADKKDIEATAVYFCDDIRDAYKKGLKQAFSSDHSGFMKKHLNKDFTLKINSGTRNFMRYNTVRPNGNIKWNAVIFEKVNNEWKLFMF